jgi:DNA repair exonuclease SbcCD nuclease subunit
MKIIHCADLHLDSKMTANLSKEQAKERKMEILRTFSKMVEYAVKNAVSVIIIAGDLFDTRNVSATVRNYVRDVIVNHPKIDFLYLRGNHDNDNFLSKLEQIPENLCLFNDKGEGSCAYVYPFKVNDIKGEFYDEWANDQDFALYFYLEILSQ